MDDVISRQAAISLPVKPKEDRYFQTQNLDDAYDYGWRSLQRCIEKLPSAEPGIIRCKDCKYWTHIKRTNRYWCKTDDGLFDLNPSPDDFCSRGERRTDDANVIT